MTELTTCGYCGSDQIQDLMYNHPRQGFYRYCPECQCVFVFHPLAGWLRETRKPAWVREAIDAFIKS